MITRPTCVRPRTEDANTEGRRPSWWHQDRGAGGLATKLRTSGLAPGALVSAAAFLAATLLAGSALAQDAPKSLDELRAGARATLQRGDTAAACKQFEEAYQAATRAAPDAGGTSANDVLFELASCHEKLGQKDLAANEFDQVALGGGAQADTAKARAEAIRKPPTSTPPAAVQPSETTQVPAGAAATAVPEAAGAIVETNKEAPPTRVGDFMDTRLTWTFGDDDVLHETGQAFPLSPNANIGDRKQYRLFFDNLNSRFGGRENLTHLALYKKMPGFIDDLDTEASLLVRLDVGSLASGSGNLNQSLYDAGSYIRLFGHLAHPEKGQNGVGLTFWPIDTDRFRLGYLYDLSWGGTAANINQSIFPRIQGAAPGARISYEHPKFNVFAGIKTAQIVQVEETLTPGTSEVEQIRVGQTNLGFLAGAGAEPIDYLRLDVGGGYFQQGKFDLPDVIGQSVFTYGFSGRAVVHDPDMPVGQSIDFLLYRNDPNKPQQIFKPEKYEEGKFGWSVSVEGDGLFQNLKDFDVTGATKLQTAVAGALQGNIKASYFRASLTGIFRDLAYVLRNQPSFIPFQSIPEGAQTDPELFFAAAADYYFHKIRLTPGIGAGLQLPATFNTTSSDSSNAPISRTVVVREQGNIAILPLNAEAAPILQFRGSLKWDISPILSAIAWAQFVHDNNGTFVERDPSEGTVALRTFVSPDFLGFGTSVQARF